MAGHTSDVATGLPRRSTATATAATANHDDDGGHRHQHDEQDDSDGQHQHDGPLPSEKKGSRPATGPTDDDPTNTTTTTTTGATSRTTDRPGVAHLGRPQTMGTTPLSATRAGCSA